jgi:hypothetical protein
MPLLFFKLNSAWTLSISATSILDQHKKKLFTSKQTRPPSCQLKLRYHLPKKKTFHRLAICCKKKTYPTNFPRNSIKFWRSSNIWFACCHERNLKPNLLIKLRVLLLYIMPIYSVLFFRFVSDMNILFFCCRLIIYKQYEKPYMYLIMKTKKSDFMMMWWAWYVWY